MAFQKLYSLYSASFHVVLKTKFLTWWTQKLGGPSPLSEKCGNSGPLVSLKLHLWLWARKHCCYERFYVIIAQLIDGGFL